MNEPSLFLLRVDSGDFKLHMSEFATQQGLQLFDPTDSFQVQEAYFDELVDPDGQVKRKLLQAKTVGDAVVALNESWPFDFSCLIGIETKLSTHDDGQCDFIVSSLKEANDIVLKVCPESIADQLWETMLSNVGKYVVVKANELTIFDNFDAYLKANKDS